MLVYCAVQNMKSSFVYPTAQWPTLKFQMTLTLQPFSYKAEILLVLTLVYCAFTFNFAYPVYFMLAQGIQNLGVRGVLDTYMF